MQTRSSPMGFVSQGGRDVFTSKLEIPFAHCVHPSGVICSFEKLLLWLYGCSIYNNCVLSCRILFEGLSVFFNDTVIVARLLHSKAMRKRPNGDRGIFV